MEDHLLLAVLKGEASDDEKAKFYKSLSENKDDEELFYEIQSLWIKSSSSKNEFSVEDGFSDVQKKIRSKAFEKPVSFRYSFLKIAALLVLFFCVGGILGHFFFHTNFSSSGIQKYTALKGSVSIVELADGTKIWLNSGSEITYCEDLKRRQRSVELKGEAYFEVVHNEELPFMVTTGKLTVYDLGTTFNLKAYPTDDFIETSLVEGKAEILNSNGKTLLSLHPGESALYKKATKQIEVKEVAGNIISAWRDGKFVIRDQRLEDIFNELSRWYNVEFQFEAQKYRDYRFTGTIKKSTTAQHVLKMLKTTTDFNYRIIEKPIGPDQIIIY